MPITPTSDAGQRDAFIQAALLERIGFTALAEQVELRDQQQRSIDWQDIHHGMLAAGAVAAGPSTDELLESCKRTGCILLTLVDDDYPERLRQLAYPPLLLFVKGDKSLLGLPAAAVVGTRECSRYGEEVAAEIGGTLAAAGVCVVSGLARGIDAAAHRGSLRANGPTCGVLGTGIDIVYPMGHSALHAAIARSGLLVTENLPGRRPGAGSFPRRNRIIAGLSDVTIVVEAGHGSGALITSDHAADLNRPVAAVPGRIDSLRAVGSNELLRTGAHVIATIDDVLQLLGKDAARATDPGRNLQPAEMKILSLLGERSMMCEMLVDKSGLPVEECLSAIGALELEGMIESTITGELRARTGALRLARAERD